MKTNNFDMTPIINLMGSAISKITLLPKADKLSFDLETASEKYKDLLDEEHTIREEIYQMQMSPYYSKIGTEKERSKDIDDALDLLNGIKREKIKALNHIAECSLLEMQALQLISGLS